MDCGVSAIISVFHLFKVPMDRSLGYPQTDNAHLQDLPEQADLSSAWRVVWKTVWGELRHGMCNRDVTVVPYSWLKIRELYTYSQGYQQDVGLVERNEGIAFPEILTNIRETFFKFSRIRKSVYVGRTSRMHPISSRAFLHAALDLPSRSTQFSLSKSAIPCSESLTMRSYCRPLLILCILTGTALLSGQRSVHTLYTEPVTEAGVTYQRPPKYDYTPEGRPVLVKRHPYLEQRRFSEWKKYRYLENMNGAAAMMACLQTYPGGKAVRPLSEQQKQILAEWGEPDYIRGPYKSTRNDFIIEWAYHQSNRLFQFADAQMVYEGPLTDQERTAIMYGAPEETMINYLEPNIRRETWIYRPKFIVGTGRERIFSFANGKLIYQQESP